MDKASVFDEYYSVDISQTSFPWWLWVSNTAREHIGHGVNNACVTKKNKGWFEFEFITVPDPAQSYECSSFTIWLWKEHGKDLKTEILGD